MFNLFRKKNEIETIDRETLYLYDEKVKNKEEPIKKEESIEKTLDENNQKSFSFKMVESSIDTSYNEDIEFDIAMSMNVEKILMIFKSKSDLYNERSKYRKNKNYRVITEQINFHINLLERFKEKYKGYPYEEIYVNNELVGFRPVGFFIESINENLVQDFYF